MTTMAEESVFIKQAIDALVSASEEISTVNPTIRELLERMQFSNMDPTTLNNIRGGPHETSKDSPFAYSQSFDLPDRLKYIIPNQTVVDPISYGSVTSAASTPSLMNDNLSRASSTVTMGSSISSYDTKSPVVRHRKTEPESEEGFPCLKCELVFLRSSDLRRHEKAHILTLPHICSRCGKGFARKDALKRHANTLTCDRNRKKLQEIAGDNFEDIIAKAQRDGVSI
ncbi:transcriptional regulator Met31p [Monosporozyma unispora]